jgi:hypothetical protein
MGRYRTRNWRVPRNVPPLSQVGVQSSVPCSELDSLTATSCRTLSEMKKSELTPKQVASVRCPTCGVPAGKCCVMHSGAPRSESHVDRKFAAIEASERKRIYRS